MHYEEIIPTALITAVVVAAICWAMLRAKPLSANLREAAEREGADPDFSHRLHEFLHPPPPPPPKPSGEPLRLLALLQREGRLLDFLLEDIQSYPNEQIGAAVRDIHKSCQKAIRDHLTLDPILPGEENAAVEVPTGFDPSAVRLTGNVTGQPPFKGMLLHHGWRVKEIKLAKPPEGQDEFVVHRAEVELA